MKNLLPLLLMLLAAPAWTDDTPLCRAEAKLRVAIVEGDDPLLCRALLLTQDDELQSRIEVQLWNPDALATVCWQASLEPAGAFNVWTEHRNHHDVPLRFTQLATFPGGCGGSFTVVAYDKKGMCLDQRVVHFQIHDGVPEICFE